MKNRVSRVSRGNIFSSFKIDRFANVCIITEVSLWSILRARPVHPKGPSSRRGEAKRLGKTLVKPGVDDDEGGDFKRRGKNWAA